MVRGFFGLDGDWEDFTRGEVKARLAHIHVLIGGPFVIYAKIFLTAHRFVCAAAGLYHADAILS